MGILKQYIETRINAVIPRHPPFFNSVFECCKSISIGTVPQSQIVCLP